MNEENQIAIPLRIAQAAFRGVFTVITIAIIFGAVNNVGLVILAPTTFGSWAWPLAAALVTLIVFGSVYAWGMARMFGEEMVEIIVDGFDFTDDEFRDPMKAVGAAAAIAFVAVMAAFACGVSFWRGMHLQEVAVTPWLFGQLIKLLVVFGGGITTLAALREVGRHLLPGGSDDRS